MQGSFVLPAVTSTVAGLPPPAAKGARVPTTRSVVAIPPRGSRRSRAAASTANNRPFGARSPGCTYRASAWVAAALRAVASTFSRSRAIVWDVGGLFTGGAFGSAGAILTTTMWRSGAGAGPRLAPGWCS